MHNIEIDHSAAYDFVMSLYRMAARHSVKAMMGEYDPRSADSFTPDEQITYFLKTMSMRFDILRLQKLDVYFNTTTRWFLLMLFYIRSKRLNNPAELINYIFELNDSTFLKDFLDLLRSIYDFVPFFDDIELIRHDENAAQEFVRKMGLPSKRRYEILSAILDTNTFRLELIRLLEWFYDEIYIDQLDIVSQSIIRYDVELSNRPGSVWRRLS